MDGKGDLLWLIDGKEDYRYSGSMVAGKFSGKGLLKYVANSASNDGLWHNGQMIKGTKVYKDGSQISSTFRDNRAFGDSEIV